MLFKFLFRSAIKNRLVTLINLLGLTLGISCATILFLFVQKERGYDRYHKNGDRIFRVAHERSTGESRNSMATTPLALAPALMPIAGIEKRARLLRETAGVVIVGAETYSEPNFCFADPEVADIFSFKFIEGSPAVGFNSNGIVITEKVAKKYYGNEPALGKSLLFRVFGSESVWQVTGVIEDLPSQSHFHFELFAPFESNANLWQAMHGNDWYYSGSAWTYILSGPSPNKSELTNQINMEVAKHLPEELKTSTYFFLQPLLDIYLNSNLIGEVEVTGSEAIVYTYFGIGIAILLLGCINYMNLSTARSSERIKEAGIRKVLGAFHKDLIRLYLVETLLLSGISALLSLCLIPLLILPFNIFTDMSLTLDSFDWIGMVLSVALSVGLLAGIYPAMYISRLKPVASLKMSKGFGGSDHSNLRRTLVIIQYTITSFLLIVVFTISAQMSFVQNRSLGFTSEDILYLNGYEFTQAKVVKEKLLQSPVVLNATCAWGIPGSRQLFDQRLVRTDLTSDNQRMEVYISGVDVDYIDFFNLTLLAGRNFSEDFVADSIESVLVNEAFVRQAGWTEGEGKDVEVFNMLGRSLGTRRVVGVLKDFNFQSLHQVVSPLVLRYGSRANNIALQLETGVPIQALEELRQLVQPYSSDGLISIRFLDQELDYQYTKERKFKGTLEVFTGLAVVISCIGLFGLASFSAQRRAKEIAIRKVLGPPQKIFCINLSLSFVCWCLSHSL